jgi:hypothetical protein
MPKPPSGIREQTLDQTNHVIFEFFTYNSPQEVSMTLLYKISHTGGNREKRKEVCRKIGESALLRVTLPPLDRYNCFQLASRLSILPTTSSQMDLVLKGAPNGRPRYFEGKEETPHPKMRANSSILST